MCPWHSAPNTSLCVSWASSMASRRRAPDAASTEYVDMFGQDLPKEAIEALRVAAMDKELSKALSVLAADLGAAEMDVP